MKFKLFFAWVLMGLLTPLSAATFQDLIYKQIDPAKISDQAWLSETLANGVTPYQMGGDRKILYALGLSFTNHGPRYNILTATKKDGTLAWEKDFGNAGISQYHDNLLQLHIDQKQIVVITKQFRPTYAINVYKLNAQTGHVDQTYAFKDILKITGQRDALINDRDDYSQTPRLSTLWYEDDVIYYRLRESSLLVAFDLAKMKKLWSVKTPVIDRPLTIVKTSEQFLFITNGNNGSTTFSAILDKKTGTLINPDLNPADTKNFNAVGWQGRAIYFLIADQYKNPGKSNILEIKIDQNLEMIKKTVANLEYRLSNIEQSWLVGKNLFYVDNANMLFVLNTQTNTIQSVMQAPSGYQYFLINSDYVFLINGTRISVVKTADLNMQ
jgi:outer membrane protein assembly factor BamB